MTLFIVSLDILISQIEGKSGIENFTINWCLVKLKCFCKPEKLKFSSNEFDVKSTKYEGEQESFE